MLSVAVFDFSLFFALLLRRRSVVVPSSSRRRSVVVPSSYRRQIDTNRRQIYDDLTTR